MKRPIATEAQELAACLKYLRTHPYVGWAQRLNVGGFYDKRGQYVRVGFVGCSDIIGQLKDGRFLAFEVKRKGKKPTDAQDAFLHDVRYYRGVAGNGTIDDCIVMMRLA